MSIQASLPPSIVCLHIRIHGSQSQQPAASQQPSSQAASSQQQGGKLVMNPSAYTHDLTIPEVARCLCSIAQRARLYVCSDTADFWDHIADTLRSPDQVLGPPVVDKRARSLATKLPTVTAHVSAWQAILTSCEKSLTQVSNKSKVEISEYFNDKLREFGFMVFQFGHDEYWRGQCSRKQLVDYCAGMLAPRTMFDNGTVAFDIQHASRVKMWDSKEAAELRRLDANGLHRPRKDGLAFFRYINAAPGHYTLEELLAVEANVEFANSSSDCNALARRFWDDRKGIDCVLLCECALSRALTLSRTPKQRVSTLIQRATCQTLLARMVRSKGIGYVGVAARLLESATADAMAASDLSAPGLKWRAETTLAHAKLALGPNKHALASARIIAGALKGAEAQAAAESFAGQAVRVVGLTGAVELNGKEGFVTSYNEDSGRLVVEIEGRTCKVKPGNVERVVEPLAAQSQSPMNSSERLGIPELKRLLRSCLDDAKAWRSVDASASHNDNIRVASTQLITAAVRSLRFARHDQGLNSYSTDREAGDLWVRATMVRGLPNSPRPAPPTEAPVSTRDLKSSGDAVVQSVATIAALVRDDYFIPRTVGPNLCGQGKMLENDTLFDLGATLEELRRAGRIVPLNVVSSCEALRALVFMDAPWSVLGMDALDRVSVDLLNCSWREGGKASQLLNSRPADDQATLSDDDIFVREFTARKSPTGASVTLTSVVDGFSMITGRNVESVWRDESPRVTLCFAATVLMRLAYSEGHPLRETAADRIVSLLESSGRYFELTWYLGYALTRVGGCGRYGKGPEWGRFQWFTQGRNGALAAIASEAVRSGDLHGSFQRSLASLDTVAWKKCAAVDVLEVVRLYVLGSMDGYVTPPLDGAADLAVDKSALTKIAGCILEAAKTLEGMTGGQDAGALPDWSESLRDLLLTSGAGVFLLRRGNDMWASGHHETLPVITKLIKKWFRLDGAAKAGYRWET
jgi:hypothetical protein